MWSGGKGAYQDDALGQTREEVSDLNCVDCLLVGLAAAVRSVTPSSSPCRAGSTALLGV